MSRPHTLRGSNGVLSNSKHDPLNPPEQYFRCMNPSAGSRQAVYQYWVPPEFAIAPTFRTKGFEGPLSYSEKKRGVYVGDPPSHVTFGAERQMMKPTWA